MKRHREVCGRMARGKKLFADGSATHSFKLTASRVTPNGLIVAHYERDGEIKIGHPTLDSPSEREIARQERMKREDLRFAYAIDPVSTISESKPWMVRNRSASRALWPGPNTSGRNEGKSISVKAS